MKKNDPVKDLKYEDLSENGKKLFDKIRPLTRKDRKKLEAKGFDVWAFLSGTDLSVAGEDIDNIFDIMFGDDELLDDIHVYDEQALVTEILVKARNKVGTQERKN